MDESDLQLYHLLILDPRLPYRELAERLGISLQAVHKRIRSLYDAGILVGTGASIPDTYLNATGVFIFGRMNDRWLKDVIERLAKNDRVGYVMLCAANILYVSGTLQRSAEMETFHSFVRDVCGMKDSTMAIESLGKVGEVLPAKAPAPDAELTPLDLRIISSLRKDARKSYADVGEEVGVTARTVRMRLDRMLEEGSIALTLKVNPNNSKTMSSVTHLYTASGVDRNALGIELMHRYPANVLFFRSYCNIPDMISLAGNHPTMTSFNSMLEALYGDPRITKVVPNVVITAWAFDTWKDNMLPSLKKRIRNGPDTA
ncbi:MAG TPA: winged helix-turn-helix transcriptional regulator [Methanomassiliicoccales archaeon]|nr:winged helix-turn-helix transcriptional regulator [Methanomassiliicoccales archaeon]